MSERCFYYLRQLGTVRRAITADAAKTLVNAFITSHVDYCNSEFLHSAAVHLLPLQSILNAAAKLIMWKQKYDRITPAMRDELHWLPVLQNLEYKVCRFVCTYLHQMAPFYPVKICIAIDLIESRRHIRAAAPGDLIVPWTKSKTYGPQSFTIAAPSVLNSLLVSTCDSLLTFSVFHKLLQTELFITLYYNCKFCLLQQ